MDIGFTLKSLRSIKGVNQQQVAAAINMERSSYAKLELNSTMLRFDQAILLCSYYGMELNYFARCLEYPYFLSNNTTHRLIITQQLKENRQLPFQNYFK